MFYKLTSVSVSQSITKCRPYLYLQLFLQASDLHPYRTKCATRMPTIRASPRKVSLSVWTSKTAVIAVVEPPPSRVKLGAVVCIYVVVVISGCEFHSILIIIGRHGSVGERIAGISTKP